MYAVEVCDLLLSDVPLMMKNVIHKKKKKKKKKGKLVSSQ